MQSDFVERSCSESRRETGIHRVDTKPAKGRPRKRNFLFTDANVVGHHYRVRLRPWNFASGNRRVSACDMTAQRERSVVIIEHGFHKLFQLGVSRSGGYFRVPYDLLQPRIDEPQLGEFEVEHLLARRWIREPEARNDTKERKGVRVDFGLPESQDRFHFQSLMGVQDPVAEMRGIGGFAPGRLEERVSDGLHPSPISGKLGLVLFKP